MANYNLAFGGDNNYNENYSLYPQNAYIEDRPEFGASKTILKPDEHWQGGHFAAVRHMSFNDCRRQCALSEIAREFEEGDTFLTHIVPAGSLITDFSFKVHTPHPDVSFTVRTAIGAVDIAAGDDGVVGTEDDVLTATNPGVTIGTIDGATRNDGWFTLTGGGLYVPYVTNNAIELVIDSWPEPEVTPATPDPCGIYGPCEAPIDFCFTTVVYYKNGRYEDWCSDPCYGVGRCGTCSGQSASTPGPI